ncbi:MAG: Na+/H+ antiporter subunit E [Actinobacteria bacterium]|nr:Na+/H+ antiporter subunit E [Actinomycetota bacterium]
MIRRFVVLTTWAFLTWVLLTWTLTVEQLAFGAGIAVAVALALLPADRGVAPWKILEPARLWHVLRLGVKAGRRLVVANLVLARRIWTPSLPIRPGMVVVHTSTRTAAGATAVGIVTSLIVDNQLVDVDPDRHELMYHWIWVQTTDPQQARQLINGPIEDEIVPLETPWARSAS